MSSSNIKKQTPKMFDIILGPVVTEKSTAALENNKVIIKVRNDATKISVKQAVESIFEVKIKSVNMINTKGKVKRFKGIAGKRSDVKKAIITLHEGSYIDFTVKA
jgi:large subunit ribosomal protein L23